MIELDKVDEINRQKAALDKQNIALSQKEQAYQEALRRIAELEDKS